MKAAVVLLSSLAFFGADVAFAEYGNSQGRNSYYGQQQGYQSNQGYQNGNIDFQSDQDDSLNQYPNNTQNPYNSQNNRGTYSQQGMQQEDMREEGMQQGMTDTDYQSQDYSKGSVQNDAKINDKIRSDLNSNAYRNVNFTLNNGHVVLTGTIERDSDRKSLVRKILGTDGVINVQNRISVTDMSSIKSVPDAKISEKIQDLLKPGFFSRGYPNVTFHIDNGHVLLTGNVATVSDRKEIAMKVEDIDGVRDVENRIMPTSQR